MHTLATHGMKQNKHETTMTSYQRKELIRILKVFNPIKELAIMTDTELHEKWLVECEYENPYKK